MPLIPSIDVIVVGRPLIEVLVVGVVTARDVVVCRSAAVAPIVIGIVIEVMRAAGIAGSVIAGIVLLMDMGCCMFIVGIIIRGAPPGGLAATLLKRPIRVPVARAARTAAWNVRNILPFSFRSGRL